MHTHTYSKQAHRRIIKFPIGPISPFSSQLILCSGCTKYKLDGGSALCPLSQHLFCFPVSNINISNYTLCMDAASSALQMYVHLCMGACMLYMHVHIFTKSAWDLLRQQSACCGTFGNASQPVYK